jgi:hypothetical protein
MDSLSVAFWYKNYQSPVIFMIDDLANIYFTSKHTSKFNSGDWGGLLDQDTSMYSFLKTKIINKFPHVKFTFFLVAGVREVQSYGEYDFVDDASNVDFGAFLNRLVNDGHEIAYHGNKHGVLNEDKKFIQEWTSFKSLNDACDSIKEGTEYIQYSSSVCIQGGKYCGYEPGCYGHESIQLSKFNWWFDRWDHDVSDRPYGEYLGDVFYFPSNIDCSTYSWRQFRYALRLKYYRSLIRQVKDGTIESKLCTLLKKRGIISLQEHSSPIRTDGKTQYPNVFSDIHSINYILKKLNENHVWWATASDVYEYLECRSHLSIIQTSNGRFELKSENISIEGRVVTLLVSDDISSISYNNSSCDVYESNGHRCVDIIVLFDCEYVVNTNVEK